MTELRCNNCAHLKEGFCSRLNEPVPNRLAKLFYGGAEGIYGGSLAYPSHCGIEKQPKEQLLQPFVLENENEDEQMLDDPNLVLDNSDW